jgi:hypothetical protein
MCFTRKVSKTCGVAIYPDLRKLLRDIRICSYLNAQKTTFLQQNANLHIKQNIFFTLPNDKVVFPISMGREVFV